MAELPLPDTTVHQYAEALRASLGHGPQHGAELWHELFERGVRQAYGKRDLRGLADMVHLASNLLDAQGRYMEAIDEVDHAIKLTCESADASTLLIALKSSLLVAHGETDEARECLARVEMNLSQVRDPFAKRKSMMYAAVAHCCLLDASNQPSIERELGQVQAEGTESEMMFLLSWFLPFLFALGNAKSAHPWERTFRLKAANARHRWRLADAEVFGRASRAVAQREPSSRSDSIGDGLNWIALWRECLLLLRWHLLGGDFAAAGQTVKVAAAHRRNVGAVLDPREWIAECADTYGEPTRPVAPIIPNEVSLWDLPAALAGAESVAIAGTQAAAIEWGSWADRSLRAGIRTSMEWPASLLRIAGVLAARAGDPRKARRLLQEAVDWCAENGYTVEHALASLQLAELCAHVGLARESEWGAMRREAWKALRELGVEPAIHAYAVSNAVMVARGDVYAPRLSPRETEVLGLLANGLTYREVADQLELKYPSVQTLAHRAYDKLGVSGRHKAVQTARELGIL
jgi:ATP/maltotriose-dependent transcriptional regulator MalT